MARRSMTRRTMKRRTMKRRQHVRNTSEPAYAEEHAETGTSR